MFAPQSIPQFHLSNLRRTNDSIIVDAFPATIQISTNLINWTNLVNYVVMRTTNMPSLGGQPQLFVRQYEPRWDCLENLRHVDWAKENWGFDQALLDPTDQVRNIFDLYQPPLIPSCPLNGAYVYMDQGTKPWCNIAGHTE
jgi:hypothetical protein